MMIRGPGIERRCILGLDTSQATAWLALADSSSLLGQVHAGRGLATTAWLLPAVDYLLHAHDVLLDQITGAVVVRGPGSFTGLRVGISLFVGLAEGRGWRLLPISTFSTYGAWARLWQQYCWVCLAAGRDRYLIQGFAPTGQPDSEIIAVGGREISRWYAEASQRLGCDALLIGTAAIGVAEKVKTDTGQRIKSIDIPPAVEHTMREAWSKLDSGGGCSAPQFRADYGWTPDFKPFSR